MNYNELTDRLKKVLNLRGSAAAMVLSNDKPELERLSERIRVSEMLNETLNKGQILLHILRRTCA